MFLETKGIITCKTISKDSEFCQEMLKKISSKIITKFNMHKSQNVFNKSWRKFRQNPNSFKLPSHFCLLQKNIMLKTFEISLISSQMLSKGFQRSGSFEMQSENISYFFETRSNGFSNYYAKLIQQQITAPANSVETFLKIANFS